MTLDGIAYDPEFDYVEAPMPLIALEAAHRSRFIKSRGLRQRPHRIKRTPNALACYDCMRVWFTKP